MSSAVLFPLAALGLLLAAAPQLAEGVACTATPADVLGPYYQASGVPVFNKKASRFCSPGAGNSTAITISGRVFGLPNCKKPLNGKSKSVLVEVWQADNQGVYDDSRNASNSNCRATIRVAKDGKFSFSTLRPARYGREGCTRAPHIHFKVSARGYANLTSQMYFADDYAPDCGCNICHSSIASLRVKLDRRGRGTHNIVLPAMGR